MFKIFKTNKLILITILILLFLSLCLYNNTNKTTTHISNVSKYGGDIISYSVCLINDSSITLYFPLISKDTIKNIELLSYTDNAINFVNCTLNFDSNYTYTYKSYNIYNFSLTFKNKSSTNYAYCINIPKLLLRVNDANLTYNISNLRLYNDEYITNNNKYIFDTNHITLTNTNTAYYTLPSKINLGQIELQANTNLTLLSLYPVDFFSINNFSINNVSYDITNTNVLLKKNYTYKLNFTLNYSNPIYNSQIVNSSLIIKYKLNNKTHIYISNIPLFVFPGYTKNFAMEQYIDYLK